MTQISLDSADWYRALTLNERMTDRRRSLDATANQVGGPTREPVEPSFDVEKAERRFQRWRSLPALARDDRLAQRLAVAGLTDDEFRRLLGEPIAMTRDRALAANQSRPDWLDRLETAIAAMPDPEPTSEPPDVATTSDQADGASFLHAFAPLIRQGTARLQAGIDALADRFTQPPFDPATVIELLFDKLPPQLFDIVGRTMALEVNVARLQGLLSGTTPDARFRSFLRRLEQPAQLAALLEEYPVMARAVVGCIDRWVEFSLEFLGHLAADHAAIAATFAPDGDLGQLDRLQGGAGDRHRGGRAVLIAGFGSGAQLVYKPRPMALDRRFQALLTWLNERGAPDPFRTLTILDRGAYGWVEFVTPAGCDTPDAVRRFYRRQGGHLALLHALAATDFHFENLMAAGEQPMLLDLEALIQPVAQDPPGLDGGASMLATRELYTSVIAIGLLPQRLWANQDSAGIDISGLGGAGGQLTPMGVPVWEATGTDEMRLERRRMPLPGGQNRPTVAGAEVRALDFTDALIDGFRQIYRLIMTHRAEWLAPGGWLDQFADDDIRVVLRPTQSYAALLHDSYHPDVLRDALDRDQLLDRLWGPVTFQPQLAKLIPAEQRDLLVGDIPIFTTRARSRDLHTTSSVIPEFFAESGLAHVRRRVEALSESDLERQLWFIHASLATLTGGVVGAKPASGASGSDRAESASSADRTDAPRPERRRRARSRPAPSLTEGRQTYLAAARAVGDRLAALAIHGRRDDVAWIGLKLENERDWSLAPMAMDFYDGLPGVALFLGYLAAVDPSGGQPELADRALTTVLRGIEEMGGYGRSIGAFAGCGGVMYALTHLGVVRRRPDLLHRAADVVDQMTPLIDQDQAFDVIGGAAGAIGSLAALQRVAPSDRIVAAARQCGERLLASATPMSTGLGWRIQGGPALLGFSHGAGGIAWALLEAADLTGEPRFRAAALDALAYERSRFSPAHRNWPDLRELDAASAPQSSLASQSGFDLGAEPSSEPTFAFMHAWCHGAPGVGLGRLAALRYLDDSTVRAEIDIALESTLAAGFGYNHSLCHGDLGNLDLLLEAAAHGLDPDRWGEPLTRVADAIRQDIERGGWRCGNPLGVESPGLMTGLAGIGYQLLRLAEPTRVPSLLTLAPPLN